MMKKNRKLMAWLLSFAMIVGCFANVGVVKAEEGGENNEITGVSFKNIEATDIKATEVTLKAEIQGDNLNIDNRGITVSGSAATVSFLYQKDNESNWKEESTQDVMKSDEATNTMKISKNLTSLDEKSNYKYKLKLEITGDGEFKGQTLESEPSSFSNYYTISINSNKAMHIKKENGQDASVKKVVSIGTAINPGEIIYEAKDGCYFSTECLNNFEVKDSQNEPIELTEEGDKRKGAGISFEILESGKKIQISGNPEKSVSITLPDTDEFDLTWDANGGKIGGEDKYTIKTKYGDAITQPENVIFKGYTRTGWKKEEGDETITDFTGKSMPSDPVTYKAVWKANDNTPYVVNHYKQDLLGNYPEKPTETEEFTGTTGAQITPATKSYEGFTAPSQETKQIDGSGTTTVTYKYKRNEYTLTWDANGGTIAGNEKSESNVKYEDTINTPNPPQKEKCIFAGWSTDGKNESEVKSKMPAGNLEYTALWKCKIDFNSNGGTNVESATVREKTSVPEPENPTKQYYTFDGWYTDEAFTNKYNFETQVDGSLTLYAKWKENEVNLILKDGDNQKTLSFAQKDGVSADKLKEYTPAGQTGKIFLGWFEEANGRQTQYTEIKSDNITGTNGEFVLNAKWANITIPNKEIFAAKGESGKTISVSSDITNNYSISYQWKKNGQDISNETGYSIPLNTNTVGTTEYSCVVKVKLGDFESTGTTGTEKVTVYNGNISITLNKSTTLKSIFGTNRKVTSMTSANKKYLTVNAKKGTLKVIKYNKKKKSQSVKVTINVDGQKFDVTVTIKLPKPTIKVKKGKRKRYIEGVYRNFKVTYKNISGATKIVSYVSTKKALKTFKKAPSSINKKTGAKINMKKGSYRYLLIYAYYGKGKSPVSNIVKLKG